MQPITRDEFAKLIAASSVRPRLRRELRFVPEEIDTWDERDFLAVMTKSGTEGVLIVPFADMAVVPFRVQKRTPNSMGRTEAVICDICASWQRGTHSQVLTFDKQKSSSSFLVCRDLDCSFHVRNKTPESVLSRTQLRENNSVEDRIKRLKQRMIALLKVVDAI